MQVHPPASEATESYSEPSARCILEELKVFYSEPGACHSVHNLCSIHKAFCDVHFEVIKVLLQPSMSISKTNR